VVISNSSGWRLAPVAVSSTSTTWRVLWACSSSMIAPCTFRPSMELASEESGMKREALASTVRLLISTWTRRLRAGEEPTMRLASSNTMRAWSRVVAAE
jgi:hypothetical protein